MPGKILERRICPFHNEDTESLVIYQDGWYHCYGCGAHGRASDLGIKIEAQKEPKYVENVQATLKYVRSLPLRRIRGFDLPCDSDFYFVVWPGADYYKRRRLGNEEGRKDKYKNPTGVTQPLYHARVGKSETCFVVEGELNALSVAEAFPEYDVVSPGSAGDFASKRGTKHFAFYQKYKELILVADKDKAGAIGAIELKSALMNHIPLITIKLIEPDANDILVQHGKEKLRETLQDALALPF